MPTLPSSRGTNSSFLLLKVLVRCRATGRLQGSAAGSCRGRCHPIPGGGLAAWGGWSGVLGPALWHGWPGGYPLARSGCARKSVATRGYPPGHPSSPSMPGRPHAPAALSVRVVCAVAEGHRAAPQLEEKSRKRLRVDGPTTAGRDVELC